MSLTISSPSTVISLGSTGLSGGGVTTPPIYVPSGETIAFGGNGYTYSGGNSSPISGTSTSQTINDIFGGAALAAQNNAAYQSGMNTNQANFLNTANQLGQAQANAAGNQGKGK